MTSVYPGAIDTFTDATDYAGTGTPPPEAILTASEWNQHQSVLVAIETALGINPQGSAASVTARLAAIDTALAGKAATAHGHAQSDVTGLTAALAALPGTYATVAAVATAQSTADAAGTLAASKADAAATTSTLATKAPLASPTFTGTPAVPTASAGTNTTQAASTAFVADAVTSASLGMVDVKRLYSLKGDTKHLYSVATTAGSPVITDANANFQTTDVGKTIRVEATTPVVTTILSRQSATQVTLSTNVATTHTGLTAYYGTDDTAGIQQAITDYGNLALAGTGSANLFFTAGCYMIAGALQDAAGYNSQLKVPYRSIADAASNKPFAFRIFGEGRAEGYYIAGAAGMPMTGTIFYSPIQGSGTEPAVIRTANRGSIYPNCSFIDIEIDGITVRTGHKSGMIALGLAEANTCRVGCGRGVTVDVGMPTNANNPTSNASVGVYFPYQLNGAAVQAGAVYVSGYGTGIKFSEHLDAKSITIQNCYIATSSGAMSHAANFDRLLIQWCNYGFGAFGTSFCNINQLDIEDGTSTFALIQHFDDGSDRMYFNIKHLHIVNPGASYVKVNGGKNLRVDYASVNTITTRTPTKTANYNMLNIDETVIANGTSITITLPSAANALKGGRPYRIKNINATSATVGSASGTIDGAATATLAQWAKGDFISDGTNWLSV